MYQYIGKSTVGTKRGIQHLTRSHSQKVNEWVSELAEGWRYPLVDVIEEVEELDDLAEREKYWINFYSEINPFLLNINLIAKPAPNGRSKEDEERFNFLYGIIQDIPAILKKERMCRGITQGDLSQEMGVSRSTVSLCERGENVTLRTVRHYTQIIKGFDLVRPYHGGRVRRLHNSEPINNENTASL